MDEPGEMSDAALDREIRDALNVAPSPEFLARVRQRIAQEPAPSPWWRRPELALGAAAAVLAVAIWSVPRLNDTGVSSAPTATIEGPRGEVAEPPAPSVASADRAASPSAVVSREDDSASSRGRRPRVPEAAAAPTSQPPRAREDALPAVILAENERAALRMLGAATRIEPPEPAAITTSTERAESLRPALPPVSFDAPDMERPVFDTVSLE